MYLVCVNNKNENSTHKLYLYNVNSDEFYDVSSNKKISLDQNNRDRLICLNKFNYESNPSIHSALESSDFNATSNAINNANYVNSPLIVYGYNILNYGSNFNFVDFDKNIASITFRVRSYDGRIDMNLPLRSLKFKNSL